MADEPNGAEPPCCKNDVAAAPANDSLITAAAMLCALVQQRSCVITMLKVRILSIVPGRAPPELLKRNVSSTGGDGSSASKVKAGNKGSRGEAKTSISAKTVGQPPGMNKHSIDSRTSDAASLRRVQRFTICEDTPHAAAQDQSFWWASQPPAFVIGIDCSVRSTGYCVLTVPAHPAPSTLHGSAAAAALHASVSHAPVQPRVAACGSISTGVGAATSLDPARFLTDVRTCLERVKRDVESEWGGGKWLVVVEDCLMQFKGSRSSADTIVNLARFNALVSGKYGANASLFSAPLIRR
jgi:hypothetical protein